ncbi:hypothetical protein L9F63_020552, partial [Diploptera punctata]
HCSIMLCLKKHRSLSSQSSFSIGNNNTSTHITNISPSGIELDEQYKTVYGRKDKKTKRIIKIKDNTILKVSSLGKLLLKIFSHISCSHFVSRLLQAQNSLVLVTCLHLLYLVTPYDLISHVKPNTSTYVSVYNNMGENELQTARILGINERVMTLLMKGLNIKSVPERVLHRFYLTLMLYDLWNQKSLWDVADKFEVPRGFVQTLMTSAATFSTCVLRFCEEIKDFWAFKELLVNFSQQLSHCCTAELLPLMDLPAVKRGRARQLYKAGYKSLLHIANANPLEIVNSIDHMPKKVATQIVAAAKLMLKQKADNLREEAEEVLEGLNI